MGICGQALQYASEELRKDREVVIAALNSNGYISMFHNIRKKIMELTGDSLKSDRDVMLAAVGHQGCLLQFASE